MSRHKISVDENGFHRIMVGMRRAVVLPVGTIEVGDILEFQIELPGYDEPLDLPYLQARVRDVNDLPVREFCREIDEPAMMSVVSFKRGLSL